MTPDEDGPNEAMARSSNFAAAMLVSVAGLLAYSAGVLGAASMLAHVLQ